FKHLSLGFCCVATMDAPESDHLLQKLNSNSALHCACIPFRKISDGFWSERANPTECGAPDQHCDLVCSDEALGGAVNFPWLGNPVLHVKELHDAPEDRVAGVVKRDDCALETKFVL